MSVTQVGSSTIGTDYNQYQKSDEVLFRTYSYQDGKGQEKVYYKKDCVELSLQSYTDGKSNLENIKEHFENEKTESSFVMFLLAAVKKIVAKDSLLLNQENYSNASDWEENDTYQSAISFLKNFNINWNFRGNRLEFLSVG